MDMKYSITEKKLEKLSKGWKVVDGKLQKKYKFSDYDEVMDFVNEVGKVAKKQNHHPDMVVKFDSVLVTMFDHEENKISDKCYKFVKALNNITEMSNRSSSLINENLYDSNRLYPKEDIVYFLSRGPKELRRYIKLLPDIPCVNNSGERRICTKIPEVIHVYLSGKY